MKITTTYVGPTDTTGSKIKATHKGKQVSIPYDYSLNSEARHAKAARAFADKHGMKVDENACESHDRGYRFLIVG